MGLASGLVATALVAAWIVFVVASGLDRTTTVRPAGPGEHVVGVELVDSYAWFDITPDVIKAVPWVANTIRPCGSTGRWKRARLPFGLERA